MILFTPVYKLATGGDVRETIETVPSSAITVEAQACFWAGRSLPTCLRNLTPLHLFIMLANHACVAAYTSAVLYVLWHAYVRGDGHS